jgi:2-polyprenyl-3-methyl-5-hydroxy-6-metoxy-1,4-benzoquinol methylase
MNDPSELLPAYFQLMNANGAAHVYREAVRCGALEALLAGPKTVEELAQICGFTVRPLELMRQVLLALDQRLAVIAAFKRRQCGNAVGRSTATSGTSTGPTCPRCCTPAVVRMDDVAKSEAHYQAQAAILGWMLTPAAQCAAELLKDGLPAHAKILDLGAGSGIWSLTLASQVEGATVTAVDWSAVLEVARETADNLGLADRLQTIAGNFHEVEIPAGAFDLAIVANVTHLLKPEANRELFCKARGALRESGRVAVIDVIPGQPAGALNVALYSLGLALRTQYGHVYSPDELETLLVGTGFGASEIIPLAVPPFAVGMVVARVI